MMRHSKRGVLGRFVERALCKALWRCLGNIAILLSKGGSFPSMTSGSETQYCYVNGRMMRDRLINHAIRQAYEGI